MSLVVDTSALIAILRKEPERESFRVRLEEPDPIWISAMNLHEARIVSLKYLGRGGVEVLHGLLEEYAVRVAVFDEAQATVAFDAHVRFGKGRHPAALNLADCAAYALAKSLDAPLLFKGDDFARTDVTPAL